MIFGDYVSEKNFEKEPINNGSLEESSSNSLILIEKKQVSNMLHTLAKKIESDEIAEYELKKTKNSMSLTIDSQDGKQRLIIKETQYVGFTRQQTELVEQQSPNERRKTVKALAQEGLSQTEIAERTMRSQKTISNDIRKLKEDGEL